MESRTQTNDDGHCDSDAVTNASETVDLTYEQQCDVALIKAKCYEQDTIVDVEFDSTEFYNEGYYHVYNVRKSWVDGQFPEKTTKYHMARKYDARGPVRKGGVGSLIMRIIRGSRKYTEWDPLADDPCAQRTSTKGAPMAVK